MAKGKTGLPATGDGGAPAPDAPKRGRKAGTEAEHVGLKLPTSHLKAAAVVAALRGDPNVKATLKSFEAELPAYLEIHAKKMRAAAVEKARQEWAVIEAQIAKENAVPGGEYAPADPAE